MLLTKPPCCKLKPLSLQQRKEMAAAEFVRDQQRKIESELQEKVRLQVAASAEV